MNTSLRTINKFNFYKNSCSNFKFNKIKKYKSKISKGILLIFKSFLSSWN